MRFVTNVKRASSSTNAVTINKNPFFYNRLMIEYYLRQSRACCHYHVTNQYDRSIKLFHSKNVHHRIPYNSCQMKRSPSSYGFQPYSKSYPELEKSTKNDEIHKETMKNDVMNVETIKENMLFESDFFGEPVTFLTSTNNKNVESDKIIQMMKSYDTFMLGVITRGKTSSGGGDEHGLTIQSAHSFALEWIDLLTYCEYGYQHRNKIQTTNIHPIRSPMMVVAAVAPILAIAGLNYVKYIDSILFQTKQKIRLLPLVHKALADYDKYKVSKSSKTRDNALSIREEFHLQTLYYLLHQNLPAAQQTLQCLLHQCPGDAFALSLVLDISYSLGDTQSALRTSASVASYWNERDKGHIYSSTSSSHPAQYSLGTSLVSLGLAVGYRFREAELLAEKAKNAERFTLTKGASGIYSLALAHVYDGEGRVAEGVSLLKGFDGTQNYEGCSMLYYDCKMAALGARFALDRDGSSADNVGFRIYDTYFQSILLEYSTKVSQMKWKRAPTRKRTEMINQVRGTTQSIWNTVLGTLSSSSSSSSSSTSSTLDDSKQEESMDSPSVQTDSNTSQTEMQMEDVLTLLPPTPLFLVDATLLLLRLTLGGAVQPKDERWIILRNAWNHCMTLYNTNNQIVKRYSNHSYFPMVEVLSHLFMDSIEFDSDLSPTNTTTVMEVSKGFQLFSHLLQLGNTIQNDDNQDQTKQWKKVVYYLSNAIEGGITLSFPSTNYDFGNDDIDQLSTPQPIEVQNHPLGWSIDSRNIWEHALCFAACQSKDYESLCLAKSICSESIVLRPNCPESWWRYSLILEQLGDKVAAENARSASVSLGMGEGGVGSH